MLDLRSVRDMLVTPGTKGWPLDAGPLRLGDVGAQGWRLADLQLPAAVLRRDALANNGRWMRRFAAHFGVALCPHGKTTMAPQIFDRQLRDGAWGLSCATIPHLQTYRRFGVRRLIYANQIASRAGALWLARALAADPVFEAYVFVDAPAGADLLAAAARAAGLARPIPLLIEMGMAGGRTGVREVDRALVLARHVTAAPELALAGVAAFEGVVAGGTDAAMEPEVEALLAKVVAAAERMAPLFADGTPPILSAGGSRFFDLVARRFGAADLAGRAPLVILRSGCYISHDAIQYEAAFERMAARGGRDGLPGRLRNALDVWAEVQSRPEPAWLYANLGKRDVSYDAELPRVTGWRRRDDDATTPLDGQLQVRRLSDQHAHVALGQEVSLGIGDRLCLGVSHPCTTFDKWRFLFELDEDERVVDLVATFF